MLRPLLRFAKPPLVRVPRKLRGTLRQVPSGSGYCWLVRMRSSRLRSLSRHDMGLGKTFAMDRILASSAGNRAWRKSSLLICPTSVLGNWQKELERFAPSLRVHLHHGPQRLKGRAFVKQLRSQMLFLIYIRWRTGQASAHGFHWKSICLDELKNIKNAMNKQSRPSAQFTRRASCGPYRKSPKTACLSYGQL